MDTKPRLRLVLFSFGFKYGAPIDINQLWDVRFLPNPYWVDELRPKNGMAPEVGAYVLESAAGSRFLSLFLPLAQCVVEESLAVGKKTLRLLIRPLVIIRRTSAAYSTSGDEVLLCRAINQ